MIILISAEAFGLALHVGMSVSSKLKAVVLLVTSDIMDSSRVVNF